MTTVEVLEKARERVAKGWTQGKAFVFNESNRAVAWCASGAIDHDVFYGDCSGCPARDLLVHVTGASSLASWNDATGRTQAEVLSAFDRAIVLAKAVQ